MKFLHLEKIIEFFNIRELEQTENFYEAFLIETYERTFISGLSKL